MFQIADRVMAQDFVTQRAVEALFFADRLGVIASRMDHMDTQSDKPCTQAGQATFMMICAPGRTTLSIRS